MCQKVTISRHIFHDEVTSFIATSSPFEKDFNADIVK